MYWSGGRDDVRGDEGAVGAQGRLVVAQLLVAAPDEVQQPILAAALVGALEERERLLVVPRAELPRPLVDLELDRGIRRLGAGAGRLEQTGAQDREPEEESRDGPGPAATAGRA